MGIYFNVFFEKQISKIKNKMIKCKNEIFIFVLNKELNFLIEEGIKQYMIAINKL